MSLEGNVKEGFTTVTAKVGAKQVDKLAKSALNNYINDMVYDILDNALDKPTGVTEKDEEIERRIRGKALSEAEETAAKAREAVAADALASARLVPALAICILSPRW